VSTVLLFSVLLYESDSFYRSAQRLSFVDRMTVWQFDMFMRKEKIYGFNFDIFYLHKI
jgi:hypothetical protein